MACLPGPSPAWSEPGCGAESMLGAGTSQWLSGRGPSSPAPHLRSRGVCPAPSTLPAPGVSGSQQKGGREGVGWGTGASLDGPGSFKPQRALPAHRAWVREVSVHAPNPLLSLPTHTLRLGPKQGREPVPAALLGNRGTTPNTRDGVSCQRRTPTWACTTTPCLPAVGKRSCGWGGGGQGAAGLPLPKLRPARLLSQPPWPE